MEGHGLSRASSKTNKENIQTYVFLYIIEIIGGLLLGRLIDGDEVVVVYVVV